MVTRRRKKPEILEEEFKPTPTQRRKGVYTLGAYELSAEEARGFGYTLDQGWGVRVTPPPSPKGVVTEGAKPSATFTSPEGWEFRDIINDEAGEVIGYTALSPEGKVFTKEELEALEIQEPQEPSEPELTIEEVSQLDVRFEELTKQWKQEKDLGKRRLIGEEISTIEQRLRGAPEVAQPTMEESVARMELEVGITELYPELLTIREGEDVTIDQKLEEAFTFIQQKASTDTEGFVQGLRAKGRTPATEGLLRALGRRSVGKTGQPFTSEEIDEVVESVFGEQEPLEIPKEGYNFAMEGKQYTITPDYKVQTNGKTVGAYNPETGKITQLSMEETMVVPIKVGKYYKDQTVTVTDDGRAFNDKGQWVGTYNRAAKRFTEAKTNEGWFKDSLIDPWVASSNRLGHSLTQFGSGVLANILFRDLGDAERKLYGDEWTDRVNAGNKILRDEFRLVNALNQRDYDEWVVKHPELIPKPEFEEGMSVHGFKLLLDPGYLPYAFMSTAPISLGVMALVAGGIATGNPLLGIAAGATLMTPAESTDAYEALLEAGAPEDQAAVWGLALGTTASLIETLSDLFLLKVVAQPIVGMFRKPVVDAMAKATVKHLIKKGAMNYTTVSATEIFEEELTLVINNAVLKVYDENKGLWDGMVKTAVDTWAATQVFAIAGGTGTVVAMSRQQSARLTDDEKLEKGWMQDPVSEDWFRPKTQEEIVAELIKGGVIEETRVSDILKRIKVREKPAVSVPTEVITPTPGVVPEAQVAPEISPKEAWQMTGEEWFNYKFDKLSKKVQQQIKNSEKGFASIEEIRVQTNDEHKRDIQKALAEGKPVPAEVLADYPDLKAVTAPTEAEVAPGVRRGEKGFVRLPGEPEPVRTLPLEEVSKLETRIPIDLIRRDEAVEIKRLTEEIQREGITEPITIRIREDGSMIVWDGIHRLIVAQDLGIKDIPVRFIGEEGLGVRKPPTEPKPPVTPPAEGVPVKKVAAVEAPTPKTTMGVTPVEEATASFQASEPLSNDGVPLNPETPISKAVEDNTAFIKDIGIKERWVRSSRKVFEKLGQYLLYKGIQKAEVLIGEERVARLKAQRAIAKTVDKNRRHLVFREANEAGSVGWNNLKYEEKQAVSFIRKWANEWADKKGLSPDKRIKDYIPHLFEAEMVAALKEGQKIDPALARMLDDKTQSKITDPFLKERLGATGFLEDPFAAMEAYDAVSLRVLYYEPHLQQVALIANDPTTPKFIKEYLDDYSRRMTGEMSPIDKQFNTTWNEMLDIIRPLPGGNVVADKLGRGNPAGIFSYNMTGILYPLWMGYKVTTAIRNLSQHTLIIAETGPKHFANGIRMRFTREGKSVLAKSLVVRGRKQAFLAGLDDSFLNRMPKGLQQSAMYMFRLADLQNVSDAYLAGYSEAKELLPNAGEKVWIERGDEVAADTQFLYTKMNSMAISQRCYSCIFPSLKSLPVLNHLSQSHNEHIHQDRLIRL